ncbi:MAG: PQQ-dependent sugar dehydrogenase [Ginsengibacter sp.]
MRKETLVTIFNSTLFLVLFNSCNSNSSSGNSEISKDPASIAKGEAIFTKNCSSCHNFKQDDIGPALGGITTSASVNWLKNFIRDPKNIIESGDKKAAQLLKKYKVAMPSFATLSDNEMDNLIAFINKHGKSGRLDSTEKGKEILNPIPETIPLSNLLVGLKLLTQFPPSANDGNLPVTGITKLASQPNTGSLFVVDLRGKLYKIKNGKQVVYMDIAKLRPRFISEPGQATGFGSFAFHPDFEKNGLLYTTHTESAEAGKADFGFSDSIKVGLQWILTEWKTKHPDADTFSGIGRELLRVNMVTYSHGMQEITFNPFSKPGENDYGMLYIGVGDGGCTQVGYPSVLHGKEKIWGSILRIDPKGRNSENGKYGIPDDNPFVHSQNTRAVGEIYSYGFRNPHRISWTKTGEMIACNIGQANIESLYLIKPGHNYGWPTREGSFVLDPYGDLNKVYPLPPNDSIYKITYPIAEYDHDDGNAISGGYGYQGTRIPLLKGKFLFGDIPTGRLFYIDLTDVKQGKQAPIKEWSVSVNDTIKTLKEICGNNRVDLRFGQDSQGELYILTKEDGKVYKLMSATDKSY